MKGGYYAKNRENIPRLGAGVSNQGNHSQEKGGEILSIQANIKAGSRILCPQSWKEPLGKAWQEVLDFIILKESAESYIATERGIVESLEPHIQYGAQKGSLIRRMQKESGVDMKDLKNLSTIYLIYMDGNKIVSKISDKQQEILKQFHIDLEVD